MQGALHAPCHLGPVTAAAAHPTPPSFATHRFSPSLGKSSLSPSTLSMPCAQSSTSFVSPAAALFNYCPCPNSHSATLTASDYEIKPPAAVPPAPALAPTAPLSLSPQATTRSNPGCSTSSCCPHQCSCTWTWSRAAATQKGSASHGVQSVIIHVAIAPHPSSPVATIHKWIAVTATHAAAVTLVVTFFNCFQSIPGVFRCAPPTICLAVVLQQLQVAREVSGNHLRRPKPRHDYRCKRSEGIPGGSRKQVMSAAAD